MAVQSQLQTKSPMNFLALPREIRQQILIEAFSEDARDADLRKSLSINRTRDITRLPMPTITKWANLLSSIHDTIALDMDMVSRQWKARYQSKYARRIRRHSRDTEVKKKTIDFDRDWTTSSSICLALLGTRDVLEFWRPRELQYEVSKGA
ncbi:hypothetical protein FKW77_007981 [Venturia effusa]|uniref:Uncharacterized protein n=1 Tax=Venturia effusa TaxID=50376 RepID=A0A517LE95_9PEZI|nr:hypothetical protein FKW77_007981 [Venturia effusa]